MSAKMGKEGVVCTAERATAQDDGADGTGSLFVGNGHVAARWILLDDHLRNDGNTHSCTDHAEQTAELAAFENNLGMQARTIAGGDGGVAKAVAVAEKYEGFGAKVFQDERATFGKSVIFRKRSEEALSEQQGRFEFVTTNGKREDGDVNGARTETVQKDGRNFFHNTQKGLRKPA